MIDPETENAIYRKAFPRIFDSVGNPFDNKGKYFEMEAKVL